MTIELNNVIKLKALAAAAKKLEEASTNKDWKTAYRELRKGCDKLWRLVERSEVKEV